jgi:hypothetical protein
MTDRILVVTPPDDILLSGIRILHVELNEIQSQTVSAALLNFVSKQAVINYVWKMGSPVEWLLDKIAKSDIVIFNASASNNGAIEILIGWTAAQPHSYYFGNLRDLHKANDRAIYSVEDLTNLLEKVDKKHD